MSGRLSWRSFYNIPVVHYSDKIVSRLSLRRHLRWKKAMEAFAELEKAGIRVYIVPLSFDHQSGSWWMDYPADYIAHGLGEPDFYDRPYMEVVLKIDDDGYLLYNQPIYISHHGIAVKKFITTTTTVPSTKSGKTARPKYVKSRHLNPEYEAGQKRKKAVTETLGQYKWFEWDGSDQKTMKITL